MFSWKSRSYVKRSNSVLIDESQYVTSQTSFDIFDVLSFFVSVHFVAHKIALEER